MKQKFTFYSFFILTIVFFNIESVYSQSDKAAVKNGAWQISVPSVLDHENAALSIRDKWGEWESFTVTFVVMSPDKKMFRAITKGRLDYLAYVQFPADFNIKPPIAGTYTVIFYVNNVLISRNKFRYRP